MISHWFLTALVLALVASAPLALGSGSSLKPGSPVAVERAAKITPDYAGIVIPPNIAPMNFVINEPGERYLVQIRSGAGKAVEVASATGKIVIPQSGWRDLLAQNAGKEMRLDVRVKARDGTWRQYQTIVNTIAQERIDPFLVYRFMTPSSYFPKRMQICQRNLETFHERVVLDTGSFGNGCAHCHSFVDHAPDQMLIGIRSTSFPSATLYVHDGRIDRIAAKFGYTAWHPSGRIAAYSINDVRQFFHSASTEIHDVVDLDSTIAYYDVATSQNKTTPAISDKQRLETYPAWTPDGKFILFSQNASSGIPWLAGRRLNDQSSLGGFRIPANGSDIGPVAGINVSQDGEWIVFESWPNGKNHDIFMVTINGTDLTPLTTDPGFDFSPAFRPK
jgi:hypothetical protein